MFVVLAFAPQYIGLLYAGELQVKATANPGT
jgi:hypothetical protein